MVRKTFKQSTSHKGLQRRRTGKPKHQGVGGRIAKAKGGKPAWKY